MVKKEEAGAFYFPQRVDVFLITLFVCFRGRGLVIAQFESLIFKEIC